MAFIDNWLVGDEKKVWFIWLFYIAAAIGLWKLLYCIFNPILICCGAKCKFR